MAEKKVDNYIIGEVLGQGSFARVYRCKNEKDGKQYAMKVIKKQALSAKQLDRLKIEIAIMQSVNHPHVIRLYDLLQTDSRYMLVMDLISGGELMTRITGPMKEDLAANFFIQAAATTRFCHGLGIVHRDIKFENLLIQGQDHVVLTDFGLGNISNSPDKTFYTSKTLCGSPHYIAPEVTNGRYDGRPADIYSLGVLLYAMLAFEFPYQADDYPTIFAKAHSGEFKMPAGISPEAQEVLKMVIVPDPLKRATWEQLFDSAFFKKYTTDDGTCVTIKQNGMKIQYKPTSKDLEVEQTLHRRADVPLIEKQSQKATDLPICPFCDEAFNPPKDQQCPGWKEKKSMKIDTSNIFDLMSIVCHAARRVCKDPIQVCYHELKVDVPGKFSIATFQFAPGKMMTRILVNDISIFTELQAAIKAVQAEGKDSLMIISDIHCACESDRK